MLLRPMCGLFLIGVVDLVLGGGPLPAAGQEVSAKETAAKAVSHFWSRIQPKDLDGFLKDADVSFCFKEGNPDHIVENIIKDHADLSKLLKEFIDGSDKEAKLKIDSAVTYAEFLKSTGDLLKKDVKLKKDRESSTRTGM